MEALEFHGSMSFIKAGIAFADRITTVSPTYAREIQTPEYGCGLDGLIRHRAGDLRGILNGVDTTLWNPATDRFLDARYTSDELAGKRIDKRAIQKTLGLAPSDVPLLGVVSRLAQQKGIDLILAAIDALIALPAQLAVLGTGDAAIASGLRDAARRYPGRVAFAPRLDESLAHQIEAGADIFLMPSRFEPCGLNQMYSQIYGTVPVVRRTGGLVDTVKPVVGRSGTGFLFDARDAGGVARRHRASRDHVPRSGCLARDSTQRHASGVFVAAQRHAVPARVRGTDGSASEARVMRRDADPRRIERLLAGREHAPVELLGITVQGDSATVYAYLPNAVSVRFSGGAELTPSRWPGLFHWHGAAASLAQHYRLVWSDAAGRVHRVLDPYTFDVRISAHDLHLFNEGNLRRSYELLGAHPLTVDGHAGTRFSVWAPNAERVSVVGDFNGWDGRCHPMNAQGHSGIWCLFVPEIGRGERYKYEIRNRDSGAILLKADPYAREYEHRPATASMIAAPSAHAWGDDALDGAAPRDGSAAATDFDLRGPPRLVATRHRRRIPQLSDARDAVVNARP